MDQANLRLSTARGVVTRKVPYYSTVTLGLRPVPMPGLGTVATTDDMVLLYDPEVLTNKWRPETLPGAYLHEVLHHVLRHSQRAAAIEAKTGTLDRHLWNLAGDIECNRLIRTMGLPMPDGVVYAETFRLPATVSAEVAYAELTKQQQGQQGQQPQGQQQQGQQGQQPQGQQGQQGQQPQGQPGQSGQQGQPGQSGQQGQQGGQPGQPGQPGQGGQQGSFAAGHCGSGCGGHPVDGEDKVPAEARAGKLARQAAERAVAEAVLAQEAKSRGSVPGEVLRQCESILAPATTPWQQILAARIRRATERRRGQRDWTYTRPSRRQAALGSRPGTPILPGSTDPVIEVAVVVDTSGSMGRAEMEAALAEIDGILRASRNGVRVLSCDAEVQRQGKVTRAADAVALLKGGGGTDFCPAFNVLAKHRPPITVVVTDGQGPAPSTAPGWTDVIWLLVGKNTCTPWRTDSWGTAVDYGTVIHAEGAE